MRDAHVGDEHKGGIEVVGQDHGVQRTFCDALGEGCPVYVHDFACRRSGTRGGQVQGVGHG